MMQRKIIFVIALFLSIVAQAQQEWYIGGNISWSHSMSENMMSKDFIANEIPGANISIGNDFSRFGGIRLSLGFNPQIGRPGRAHVEANPDTFKIYRFHTATAYVDGLFNLTEMIFSSNVYRTANLYALVGVGVLYNWGLDDRVNSEMWRQFYPVNYDADGNSLNAFNKFYPALRLGGVGVIKVSKSIDLSIEAKYSIISDRYNGVLHGGNCDGYVDFNIGVVWYLGKKHRERPEKQDLRHNTIDQEKRFDPELYTKGERMFTGISFYIDRSNVTPQQRLAIKHVADFLARRTTVNLIIHSYCDTKKGNEEHNQRLSENRAKEVYDIMTETYHIDPSRLTIQSHNEPLPVKEDSGEWIRGVEFEMQ